MIPDSDGPNSTGSVQSNGVLDAFEPFIELLADRISARLMKGRERMISQTHSDLGPRKHRAAVKRRLANGEGGAGMSPDGRRFLLTPEALREELAGKSGKRPKGGDASPAPATPGPDRKPSPNSPAGVTRTRAAELNEYERDLIAGLRAVGDRR